MSQAFDRSLEDIGNILQFGHVNVEVPDQLMAQAYYVATLGLTRDPYSQTGLTNMWINVGASQFHLPTGDAMLLGGHVGVVMPDRAALLQRLAAAAPMFSGTRFSYTERADYLETTSPWGNRTRFYEPQEAHDPMWLGIAYVEFEVPVGTADGIGRFYDQIFLAPVTLSEELGARVARVQAGQAQQLVFRETAGELPPYDGHHIQIYIGQFAAPYRRLQELDLITQESSRYQYRFKDIKDPSSGKLLYTVEHEVRSMTHPQFMRPLVNRNPALGMLDHFRGASPEAWSGPPRRQPG